MVAIAGVGAPAAQAAELFDKPDKVVHVPLPRDPANPRERHQVSCFFFPHVMVKEVELAGPGAEQLSLLPLSGDKKPACRRENAADERVIAAADWTGSFKGVKGAYVFFDAEDGWNDGMGFAVVAADSGRKLFDDVAKSIAAIRLGGDGISVRYVRVFGASCSLRADATGCWRKIQQDTGLAGTPPDCTQLYEKERKRTPEHAQQVIDDPTIVDYEATATISGTTRNVIPTSGKALGCRPAE
jgi:hypothetical protein